MFNRNGAAAAAALLGSITLKHAYTQTTAAATQKLLVKLAAHSGQPQCFGIAGRETKAAETTTAKRKKKKKGRSRMQ